VTNGKEKVVRNNNESHNKTNTKSPPKGKIIPKVNRHAAADAVSRYRHCGEHSEDKDVRGSHTRGNGNRDVRRPELRNHTQHRDDESVYKRSRHIMRSRENEF
jgi:hypothetical protein